MAAILAAMAAVLLGDSPIVLDRPLRWPPAGASVTAAIRQIADAADVSFVLASSAETSAKRRAPGIAGSALRVRTGLGVLSACAGLEFWLHDGVLVVMAREDRPALLAADARDLAARPASFPAIKGTLDVDDAPAEEAFAAMAAAFDVPVAYCGEAMAASRVKIDAEDIDLESAASIVAEGVGTRAWFASGAVIVGPYAGAAAAVDTGGRAADIREARRLAGVAARGAEDHSGD